MATLYCGHSEDFSWRDWSTDTRYCRACGCAQKKDGTRFQTSPELVELRVYCVDSQQHRGIWKVIDEQRELLELLKEHAPELLERYGCIENWLARTDMFLVNLAKRLGLPDTPSDWTNFPRKWPGSYTLSYDKY